MLYSIKQDYRIKRKETQVDVYKIAESWQDYK